MGKCLITKLAGVASNTNLLKLNESRFIFTNNESTEQSVSFDFVKDAVIESNTEVTIKDEKTVKLNVSAGNATIKIPAKTEAIISIISTDRTFNAVWCSNTKLVFNTGNIKGKTDIKNIYSTQSVNVVIDIDSQALSNASIIRNGFGNIRGSLKNLSPNITDFTADGQRNVCTGNISEIKSTVLTNIVVDYALYLRGSIEAFVESQVKLGRTSGTINFRANYTAIKYNNISFSTISINFGSDNVTVSGSGVKTGTFNKASNTWEYSS